VQIVNDHISIAELKIMSEQMFGSLVKAVVDIEKEIMVVDADLHADEELILLEEGSQQENLWGINIYPDRVGDLSWIVFDSMINLRPSQRNRTRGVENPQIQEKIRAIVNKLVKQS